MRSKRRIFYWLVVLPALVAAVWVVSSDRLDLPEQGSRAGEEVAPPPAGSRPTGVPARTQEGKVARVVDGDTILVDIEAPGGDIPAGDGVRVRLLEIDTPETVRPNYPVQCGGRAAGSFAAAELPKGSTVYLQADREDKDEFGRYLRYVWDFEGEFFNEKAVAEGYARAVLYRPNDMYIDRMRRAEASARQAGKGVWGEVCAGAQ